MAPPGVPLIAEADDLAGQFYETACDDLEPEAMRLLARDAAEIIVAVLDALIAGEEEGLGSALEAAVAHHADVRWIRSGRA